MKGHAVNPQDDFEHVPVSLLRAALNDGHWPATAGRRLPDPSFSSVSENFPTVGLCAPDALHRTPGHFGNLHERGLMDIWNGESYRRLITTNRNRPLCIGYTLRRPVAGS